MLVSFVLGSIHAFSVLLQPLEQSLTAPRSEVSLIYSLALVSLTIAVLVGHRLYSLVSSARLFLTVCCSAAIGVWLSKDATNLMQALVCYSLIFGFANGVGYGFSLQFSAQVMPHRKGFAMGAVTASYAFGAMLFVLILRDAVVDQGLSAALSRLAISLLCVGILSAALVMASGLRYQTHTDASETVRSSNGTRSRFTNGNDLCLSPFC